MAILPGTNQGAPKPVPAVGPAQTGGNAPTPGGTGTAQTSAPNPSLGGLNSVVPGWQGPQTYSTGQASISDTQAAQLQAAQQQAAQQYASGVLGSFFGSGPGYAPQYSPAYQNAYPAAYAQSYQQIAASTPPPAGGA